MCFGAIQLPKGEVGLDFDQRGAEVPSLTAQRPSAADEPGEHPVNVILAAKEHPDHLCDLRRLIDPEP